MWFNKIMQKLFERIKVRHKSRITTKRCKKKNAINRDPASACMVCSLFHTWCVRGVFRYLHRFDSELEQIELVNGIKGRQGRLHGAREAAIKQTLEREREQYDGVGFGEFAAYCAHTSGVWKILLHPAFLFSEIPDIINAKHLKTFRWVLERHALEKQVLLFSFDRMRVVICMLSKWKTELILLELWSELEK